MHLFFKTQTTLHAAYNMLISFVSLKMRVISVNEYESHLALGIIFDYAPVVNMRSI